LKFVISVRTVKKTAMPQLTVIPRLIIAAEFNSHHDMRWLLYKHTKYNYSRQRKISGFRHRVIKVLALLGCYTAQGKRWFPTLRDNLLVPSARVKQFFQDFLTLAEGTGRLSRSVGNQLPNPCCVKFKKSEGLNSSYRTL
jgi:hypothetical protein